MRSMQVSPRHSGGFFSPGASALRLPAPKRAVGCRAGVVRVTAYREAEKIQDWRVKEMAILAHTYFSDFLSKGKVELADSLFSDEALHVDKVWDPVHPTVGRTGMRHYLEDLKAAFPDFWVEIDEIATVNNHSIMVSYRGSATNLGEYHHHRASHHSSVFEGINLIKFTQDRSAIAEVQVFRSAFAEDRHQLAEKDSAGEGGFRELRLKRLV